MIDLASQTGARLRQQFGLEKLSQLEADGVRAEVPSNPEAMRPYSQGLASTRAFDALSAQAFLSNAVAIDPGFPLAHSELARTWSSLGYDANAQQEAKKAMDEAGNLSREKHLLVEARFYETSRNWPKAIEAYQTLFSFFPDNLEYGLQLANAETTAGRGKDALKSLTALDAFKGADKRRPANQYSPIGCRCVAWRQQTQARHGRARRTASRASKGPNSWWLEHEILNAGL